MNTEQPKLNPEAQAIFDSVRATVRMCRWFYECGLKEGFTPKQAMELANNYIIALFGGKKS